MRKFVDVHLFDGGEELAKKMGFWRVYGPKRISMLEGNLRTLRRGARRAWREGKVPIAVARKQKDAKKALMAKSLVVLCRCPLDASTVHIAENHGSTIALDLRWGRKNIRTLAKNVWILHRARARYLFFSAAEREEELRSPREMAALLHVLGEEEPRALAALSTWWEYVRP